MWRLTGIFCLLAWLAAPAGAAPLALQNLTIVDADTGQRRANMTVIIDEAKIVRVGPTPKLKLSSATPRINARGKYLIPGLWDMHVHLFNNSTKVGTNNSSTYFPLLISYGVTGVRDMWTDAEDHRVIKQWRHDIEAGNSIGPRIVAGSRILDGSPVSWTNSVTVTDPAAAKAVIRAEIAAGAQFLKVYERLSRAPFFAIAQEAKRQNIPFAGHVPFSVTALEAAAAGQASIEHLTDMLETCSSSETKIRALPEGKARAMLSASAFDVEKCRRAGSRFKQLGTAHTPTLVMHEGRLIRPFDLDADPRLRFVPADGRKLWAAADERIKRRDSSVTRDLFATELRLVAELSRGGARILAGTDLGNPHVFAGSSLHDEMALMVKAGMSPQAALASATINAVKYLGLQRQLGTIETGKLADLVLLDADPLADIANTRRIAAVISNGRYFSAPALAKMRLDAARAARHTQ